MGKFKDRFNAIRQTRVYRVVTNKFVLATTVLVVWLLFFDSSNIVNFYRLYTRTHEQEKVIRQLQYDMETVKREHRELNSNRDSLEKFARERYFFHKEGETIFLYDEGRPSED